MTIDVGDELSRTVGTGSFERNTGYTSPYREVEFADLDGDGALDLITAGYNPGIGGGFCVRFNDGGGNFGEETRYATIGTGSVDIAAVDVDGDGALDLITADYDGGGRAAVALNDGHGHFGSVSIYTAEISTTFAVTVVDMNGDGSPDLITAGEHGGKGQATVRLNDGKGNFGSASIYTMDRYQSVSVVVSDINGDGAADLVTAGVGAASGSATVRLNDGRGNFGAAGSYTTEGSSSYGVSLADVNGDGSPDLVTAGCDAGLKERATVRLNDGQGNFGSAVSYTSDTRRSYALNMTDINGDGWVDMLTAVETGAGLGGITVRLNDGSGKFSKAVCYSIAGSSCYDIAVADVTGDDVSDLASISSTASIGEAAIYFAFTREVTTVGTLDLFSQDSARKALTTLKSQLDRISSERGAIGSSQSRLSVALNTLHSSRENVNAAEARIMDIDVAQESADLVRTQILQQVGSAILAQANLSPNLAIQLLS